MHLKWHNKQKNHICGNHETPKAGAKHELCWTSKSVSSSITNCDKNHISGNHKFGEYQKQGIFIQNNIEIYIHWSGHAEILA